MNYFFKFKLPIIFLLALVLRIISIYYYRDTEIANEWGTSAAKLAHRYALSIDGISSVILGVKNREELEECIEAEQEGKLTPAEIETLQNLF